MTKSPTSWIKQTFTNTKARQHQFGWCMAQARMSNWDDCYKPNVMVSELQWSIWDRTWHLNAQPEKKLLWEFKQQTKHVCISMPFGARDVDIGLEQMVFRCVILGTLFWRWMCHEETWQDLKAQWWDLQEELWQDWRLSKPSKMKEQRW